MYRWKIIFYSQTRTNNLDVSLHIYKLIFAKAHIEFWTKQLIMDVLIHIYLIQWNLDKLLSCSKSHFHF